MSSLLCQLRSLGLPRDLKETGEDLGEGTWTNVQSRICTPWPPVQLLDRRAEEFGTRHRVMVLTRACLLNLEYGR